MDIITDLSSEAVSFLTVIQDICRGEKARQKFTDADHLTIWDAYDKLGSDKQGFFTIKTVSRINEIIWLGNSNDIALKQKLFLAAAEKLLFWLKNNIEVSDGKITNYEGGFSVWNTPNYWRNRLKSILYRKPESRIGLVEAIHYMPVQIVYALSEKQLSDVYEQRLYQFYYVQENADDKLQHLLSPSDVKKMTAFWDGIYLHKSFTAVIDNDVQAEEKSVFKESINLYADAQKITGASLTNIEIGKILLNNTFLLLAVLDAIKITVPFVSLFEKELQEIEDLRANRRDEAGLLQSVEDFIKIPAKSNDVEKTQVNYNPEKKADAMQLARLAFSGGGIRSATFNLGILQKLAELGALPRFDYLSTVSGGGYIGAWCSSWIYRNSSQKKIIGRMNSKRSTDPLADEVRPIRWLRMYSNYLSPNTGIMSADSWTVGITWLRNTFINQIILLLILLSVLAAIDTIFQSWEKLVTQQFAFSANVFLLSCLIIGIGTYLAGAGMKSYNWKYPPTNIFKISKHKKALSTLIILWSFLSAIGVAFLFVNSKMLYSFSDKIDILTPGFWPCLIGMLGIAFIGGYHRNDKRDTAKGEYSGRLILAIIASSLIASASAVVLLSVAWRAIQALYHFDSDPDHVFVFVFGVPIILETICIAIVIRMVIMGKFFPDERREWWGRMGAMLHRFMFWWIVITLAALWLPHQIQSLMNVDNIGKILGTVGGWVGLIGIAVKMAFSASESNTATPSGMQRFKDIFIRIAPYLFLLGFLLIGASVLETLKKFLIRDGANDVNVLLYKCYLTLGFLTLTFLLSWRAGVNEFSLHDFYKNRLVRAYMGATRRRSDREQTANNFTGFDKNDDFSIGIDDCKKQLLRTLSSN